MKSRICVISVHPYIRDQSFDLILYTPTPLSLSLISIQSDRPGVQIYSWKTAQARVKSSTTEKLTAVAVSHDGLYCAAGTPSGKIYMWDMVSGELLKVWDAHYKAISALSFTHDDAFLVTCGDDALVSVWLMGNVLSHTSSSGLFNHTVDNTYDASAHAGGMGMGGYEDTYTNDNSFGQGAQLRPWVEWTDHGLPVTGVWCGAGHRFITCSYDRTVKCWDIPSKSMVFSFVFPAAIRCVLMNSDQSILCAGGNNGNIYRIHLLQAGHSMFRPSSSSQSISDGNGKNFELQTIRGHRSGQPITGLDLSFNNSTLVSSSVDGTARVWDMQSGRLIHLLNKQSQQSQLSNAGGNGNGRGLELSAISIVQDVDHFLGIELSGALAKKNQLDFPIFRKQQARPEGDFNLNIRVQPRVSTSHRVTELARKSSVHVNSSSIRNNGGFGNDCGTEHDGSYTGFETKESQEKRLVSAWIMNNTEGHELEAKVEAQAHKIAALQQELEQWKNMNHELYSFSVTNLLNQAHQKEYIKAASDTDNPSNQNSTSNKQRTRKKRRKR